MELNDAVGWWLYNLTRQWDRPDYTCECGTGDCYHRPEWDKRLSALYDELAGPLEEEVEALIRNRLEAFAKRFVAEYPDVPFKPSTKPLVSEAASPP